MRAHRAPRRTVLGMDSALAERRAQLQALTQQQLVERLDRAAKQEEPELVVPVRLARLAVPATEGCS